MSKAEEFVNSKAGTLNGQPPSKETVIKWLEDYAKDYHKEQLKLHSVSQRSELFALLRWMQNKPVFNIDDIDEILDDYDFYKANCG